MQILFKQQTMFNPKPFPMSTCPNPRHRPTHPARILSPPATPGVLNRSFSIPQGQKPPQQVIKSDFCCSRDRWLHSGEDVEIQVRCCSLFRRPSQMTTFSQITDAQKTSEQASSPYIAYIIKSGVSCCRALAALALAPNFRLLRMQLPTTATQTLNHFGRACRVFTRPSLSLQYPQSKQLGTTPSNKERQRRMCP